MTVLGNPLMAVAMLWLANQKEVMGDRRNAGPPICWAVSATAGGVDGHPCLLANHLQLS